MSKILNKVKQPFQDTSKLSYIFKNQPHIAWQMIQQQCNIYTNPKVDVQDINQLNSIYCKIVIKLNQLQDPRQKYFNNKMQKLMAQPFIIRCYTDSAQNKNTDTNLNQKRKQLQQKLSIENQKQNNHAFQHIIQSQNQKQKKLKQKISQVIVQHQKNLQSRLQLRSMKKMMTSPIKKHSQDSALSSSQSRNPELTTPTKQTNSLQLSIQQLVSPKNYRSDIGSSQRPLTDRIINYKFKKIDKNQSSSDSQDQYQIQKLLRQQGLSLTRKKQSQISQKSFNIKK